MDSILITGGLGFVGRHLTKRLLSQGHHVTIVDNRYEGSGWQNVVDWMPHLIPTQEEFTRLKVHFEDCRDFFSLYRHFPISTKYRKYDRVFHLAAVVGGRLTIENDPLAVAQDLSIDAEFFHWLSYLGYKSKVYYFSSSAAYPIELQTARSSPLLEESFQDFTVSVYNDGSDYRDPIFGLPDMTYGWAKLTGEFLARTAHQKYGIDITCFRPFSGYGEDQDLSYPFPSILQRVMDGENPITVWGSGEQQRDFIYIEDCIDGILHLGEHIHDGSSVNLSTGKGTSFNNLAIGMYLCWNGPGSYLTVGNPNIINTSDKPEGVFKRVGSTRLQKQLGFEAKTTLIDGIYKSINYINAAKSINSNPAL